MADALTIHERMVAILRDLPAIGKNQRNPQQNFMFRGHDDVMNALNPLLSKHGVFVVPSVLERVTEKRTTSKGSTMFEVNLHVQYAFWGAAGDFILASAWGEGTDMGDKSTNKAMTMAFKNVLNQAFAISTADTIDSDAGNPEHSETAGRKRQAAAPRSQPPPVPAAEPDPAFYTPEAITDVQRRRLYALFTEKGIADRDKQLAFCSQALGRTIESSKEMGKAEATAVIRQLEEYDPENPQTYPFPAGY